MKEVRKNKEKSKKIEKIQNGNTVILSQNQLQLHFVSSDFQESNLQTLNWHRPERRTHLL
jgi:hypothetical protein